MEAKRMDADELKAVAARAEAATLGPWRVWEDAQPNGYSMVSVKPVHDIESVCQTGESWASNVREDAAFIANARTDVPKLLAHVAALEALLRRVWQDVVDGSWIGYDRRDYDHDHMICLQCDALVTYHFFGPNQHGGQTYLGHSCEHAPDCLVPQVEQALGIDNQADIAAARAKAQVDAVTLPSIHDSVLRNPPTDALPPIVDWKEHG